MNIRKILVALAAMALLAACGSSAAKPKDTDPATTAAATTTVTAVRTAPPTTVAATTTTVAPTTTVRATTTTEAATTTTVAVAAAGDAVACRQFSKDYGIVGTSTRQWYIDPESISVSPLSYWKARADIQAAANTALTQAKNPQLVQLYIVIGNDVEDDLNAESDADDNSFPLGVNRIVITTDVAAIAIDKLCNQLGINVTTFLLNPRSKAELT